MEAYARHDCNPGVYFHTAHQESGFPNKGVEIQINNTAGGEGSYRERKKTARGRGRIVNVASGAGTVSIPYMSAYVSANALIRLTETLADELRGHGISVFAIQPGTIKTAMTEELMHSKEGKRWLPWFKQIFDNGLDDSPKAAEELVLYLASGEADSLSGRFFAAPGAPGNLRDRIIIFSTITSMC